MAQKTGDISAVSFGRNGQGDVCITFADPAYVRAEAILIDRADSSVHAVLHEAAHFVGYIDGKDAGSLTDRQAITLAAPHYFRGEVHMKSKISIL